jgi:amino acid adenylation domain-containing protein/non-ribosomal peptide synthase protein (TIGR01720 family)
MEDHSKRIEDLSPEKRALLLMRLRKIREASDAGDSKIARRFDLSAYPLSFAQQRMWFLSQWEPESPFYNISSIIQISGFLDVNSLKRAIKHVYSRHEILHARINSVNGKPVQKIMRSETLDIHYDNFSTLEVGDKKEKVDFLIFREINTGFDLSKDTLIRCKIIENAPAEFFLLVTMHHIVSDGWSIGIFIREVSFFYEAYSAGNNIDLAELTIQYPDFAEWQKQRLQPPFLQELIDYWKAQFQEEHEFLELPVDFPRPGVQTFMGAHLRYTFPDQLRNRLGAFGKKHEISLFMLLLAAFEVLLFRYTNQESIHIGIPVANRNRKELEELIGLFVNTIVINGKLQSQTTFSDFLNQIKERVLGGYAHQELPFEMLVEELKIVRDLSHTPLFQVMFALQTSATKSLKVSNLHFNVLEPENGTSKFDLTLFMEDTENGLDAIFEYNTDLFRQNTIKRMADQFGTLLTGILENENQLIGKLPLLSPAEKQKILVDWNNNFSEYPSDRNLVELFEAIVEKYPNSIAVSFQETDRIDQVVTYHELNQKANQLARSIKKHIHQPGDLVALFMDRSLEMVVATLAILKAGCAYLPIDLGYPSERVNFMLEDGQVPVIITNTSNFELIKELAENGKTHTEVKIICLNDEVESTSIDLESRENLNDYPSAETIAYVMYTSGSTGRPKGVAVPHRAITRLVFNTNYLVFGQNQRIAHISNPSFDAATFEIWGALLHGGQLLGIPKEIALNTQKYIQYIREKQISATFLTVALFNHIVREDPDAFQTMETVMFGGEAADLGSIKRVLDHHGPKRLINAYGPTESTTFATWYLVENLSENIKSLPIGKPLTNTLLYVLDQYLEPVPVGVPGELYIGGDGLALGYFRRPELTAEKFIPNPYINLNKTLPGIQIHDQRIYKTGDRVRYLPDGNIDFLGRFDFQVKLRGLRIELGEIENAIGSYPLISTNIVIVREDTPGDKRLVSYFVTQDSIQIDINDLRGFLKQKLPDFMIPSGFVYLDHFPLNPNGKIDRKQLPVPGDLSLGASDIFVAPRNPDEETLSGIWQELLGIQRISINDNFFALGGHSLLVTQLVSRIRTLLTVDLQIKHIFENPTISEQAVVINTQRLAQSGLQLPELVSVSRNNEMPLTFSQQRLWFLEQLKPDSPDYNIPTSVRITGTLDESIMKKCLAVLVTRHESLRMAIKTVDGKPGLDILPDLELPFRTVDLSEENDLSKETAIDKIIRDEAQIPFDLSKAPLVRFLCVRIKPDQHIFVLIFHHIISDGWSANIFYKELASLYSAFIKGEESPLWPLSYQYVDYAFWQRKYLQGQFLENELAYWKQKLSDAPPLLELPTDFSRPAIQSGQGDFITFELSQDTTQRIYERCNEEGVTLFMFLLSTFYVLLYRYTNQADICLGTPIANRDHEGIENIIGFFVNTLVIRANLDGDPGFSEVLHQVRETAMDAYTHSTIPFEMVVDAVDPVRNLGFNPIFQVMFTLQEDTGASYQQLQSVLTLEPIDVHGGISIFDLTLSLAKSGNLLRGAIEYCTDLFNPETISRMISHFKILLDRFLIELGVKIGEPSLLSHTELETILEWNQTSEAIPQVCLHELFHQAAISLPEQIAILEAFSDEKKVLNYKELDSRSTKLAIYLNQLGVGSQKIVGLCLERTFNLYIGMLGILKSGGAYLPLDPTYPHDRLHHMITDSKVEVIISQESLLGFLGDFDVQIIDIEKDWEKVEVFFQQDQHLGLLEVDPADPAYVIYTSGSTGKPKGVSVSHRSVINHNLSIMAAFKLDSLDRVLQFSTINFDAAVEEIFPTWFSGATLVIPPLSMITRGSLLITPKDLTDLVNSEKINILDFSTAFWHEWVHELGKSLEFPDSVRLVVVGGEKARRDVYDKWVEIVPDKVDWLNTYGPTEATIVATIFNPDGLLSTGQDIPIGKPITNLRAHILDHKQNLVPIGLPGELYLGGTGVAIGYLNQPELNASKFFPDILFPEERMYKTGDKARWLRDGNIEFMGRFDSQVKIRGFRIEIDEIETHVIACPLVKDAVVIPINKSGDSNSGIKMLAAYVVLNRTEEKPEGEIRTYLKTKLPDYMIPGVFRFVDQLPRLPNGKVDRRGLPDQENGTVDSGQSYVAPRDEIEKILVEIWQDVLGVTKVGIDDNFFELGGDSILSIQVVSRARKSGLQLQPRQLFEAQTIAELSKLAESDQFINIINQGEVVGEMKLTPIQQWFFDQEYEEYWHWNQAILVEVKQKLDVNSLQETFRHLLYHHDALRLRFRKNLSGDWIGHIKPQDEEIPLHIIDLSDFNELDQDLLLTQNVERFQKRLNIETGPILQLVYFQFGILKADRLFFVIHHLAVDGVSWRILLEDLQTLYDQIIHDKAPTLPLKSTSILEWSDKLSQYAQKEDFDSEKAFWLKISEEKIPSVPVDFPNQQNNQEDEGVIQVFIDEGITGSLLRDIPTQFGADINDALVTILVKTLASWIGSTKIRFDLEGHGRQEIISNVDLSRTVGWFTSVYPMVFTQMSQVDLRDSLISIKEQLRSIPHKGINYGVIKYLKYPTSRSKEESSEISYNYLGQINLENDTEALFGIAQETVGHSLSPRNRRSHLLDFIASIVNNQLCLEWRYSQKIHHKDTIDRISQEFKRDLLELSRLCSETLSIVYSPSDFKDVDLRQDEIDLLMQELGLDEEDETT